MVVSSAGNNVAGNFFPAGGSGLMTAGVTGVRLSH